MAERIGSTLIDQNSTFLLRRSKEQICSLCTKVVMKKDFKRKLTKACLNLELIAGKEIVAKVHF